MSNELQVAIEAAKKGAEVALKYYKTELDIEYKTDKSPVTIADKEAEQIIRKTILSSFPKAQFLGEEGGGSLDFEEFWTIDPIDGTQNFMRQIPFWGVEIALVRNSQAVVGVSYAPVLNELVYAEESQGAFLNDKKISVSKTNNLKDAFIVHGALPYFKEYLESLVELLKQVKRERGFGDFYGHHLVATGRADVMIDARNMPWDVAAASIIAKESGGKFTNFKGAPWQLENSDVIFSNGLIHDEIVNALTQK